MESEIVKNIASYLGLFLVLGLLIGVLLNQPALGVLSGLTVHVIISGLFQSSNVETDN